MKRSNDSVSEVSRRGGTSQWRWLGWRMVTENIATWTKIPSLRTIGLESKREEGSEPMSMPTTSALK